MKNILIVDDRINSKLPMPVLKIIKDLSNVEIRDCMNTAIECMKEKSVDGIILDLGFCSANDSDDYEEKMGIRFLRELNKMNIQIPSVLIYSTTVLKQEEIDEFKQIKGIMMFLDVRLLGKFIYSC